MAEKGRPKARRYDSLAIANKPITRHQLEIATELLTIGGEELLKLSKKIREYPDDLILDPDLILRFIKEGATLQRLILGQPTEITEKTERKVSYEQLTIEELNALKSAKDKLDKQLN